MKKILVLSVILLCLCVFQSCSTKSCQNNIIDVVKLSDSVYREEYLFYAGGVFGGDITYSYLTDSMSFRVYVGKYDDNGMIIYNVCPNDSIKAYKITDIGLIKHRYDTSFLQSYSVSVLRENNVFEIPCVK